MLTSFVANAHQVNGFSVAHSARHQLQFDLRTIIIALAQGKTLEITAKNGVTKSDDLLIHSFCRRLNSFISLRRFRFDFIATRNIHKFILFNKMEIFLEFN